MKRRHFLIIVVCALLILGFSLAIGAAAQDGAGQSAAEDDDHPAGAPLIIIPERYRSTADTLTLAAGGTEIYFTPQDQNESVTLIFLYNTGTADRDVMVETFRLNGAPYVSQIVNVPAGEMVRISADTVATVGGSWASPVVISFTSQSAYGRLTLPADVKADAYVAWNGFASYDPRIAVPVLSLRFSTDPATLFLPAVESNKGDTARAVRPLAPAFADSRDPGAYAAARRRSILARPTV